MWHKGLYEKYLWRIQTVFCLYVCFFVSKQQTTLKMQGFKLELGKYFFSSWLKGNNPHSRIITFMAGYSSHKNDCSKGKKWLVHSTQNIPVINATVNAMCINVTCVGSPGPMISFTFFMKTIIGKSAYSQNI